MPHFLDYLSYSGENLFTAAYFPAVVYEKNVGPLLTPAEMFLQPVAFPYATFQKIPFYCPFEQFFGNRNHDSAVWKAVVRYEAVPEPSA